MMERKENKMKTAGTMFLQSSPWIIVPLFSPLFLGFFSFFRDNSSLTSREIQHNGISHCTLEYLPRQHRWKDLPPLLSAFFPSLCFPLQVWIDLTVLFQLSLQQQMSAILKLNLEPGPLAWAQGYLTCLTRVSQSSFCSRSKRGSSTVEFADIF